MPSARSRRASSSSMHKGDVEYEKMLKEEEMGYSDDEDTILNTEKGSASSHDFSKRNRGRYEPLNKGCVDRDEVEDDIEMFNKNIHITNVHQVDHGELLRKMHSRFKRKSLKWEGMARRYAVYAFTLNFAILLFQVFQMIIHRTSDIMNQQQYATEENIARHNSNEKRKRTILQKLGIKEDHDTFKLEAESGHLWMTFQLDQTTIQTIQVLLSAGTALMAGLQLKLKLSEKSEKYRRGAKVYSRLLRMSTYYIMIVDSGGKIDDVTALWREAMHKEETTIPCVKTFMPM